MSATIDVTKEHCPMTFVKVKLALARIKPGEQLEVLGLLPIKWVKNQPVG
jgi:tRNA 2-thiouridine synthesizing protein A